MNKYRIYTGEEGLGREEIVDFLSRIFGPNYYDAHIVQETTFDAEPSISPKNFILARSSQGDLVGVVRIVERNIMIDGVVLLLSGCISSVGIKPEWRGRGVASNMINTALKIMASRGMDISVVYGRRAVDGFYSRFGYYGVGRYVDLEILSSAASKSSIDVRPYKNNDIKKCMEFYDNTYKPLAGSVLRDRAVWDYLFLRMKKDIGGFKLFICLENKKVIGYLVVFNGKLIETSLPPRVFPFVPNILTSLDINSISIHPRHPFYVYCRTQMNTIQKERFAIDGGYMARILNPESLLKKLGPVLALRACGAGLSDEVIRLFNCEVDLNSGQVSKASKPDDINFKKAETAVLFMLGVISPYDVAGVKWTSKKPWIPYLFPELYYHTSAWDEV